MPESEKKEPETPIKVGAFLLSHLRNQGTVVILLLCGLYGYHYITTEQNEKNDKARLTEIERIEGVAKERIERLDRRLDKVELRLDACESEKNDLYRSFMQMVTGAKIEH